MRSWPGGTGQEEFAWRSCLVIAIYCGQSAVAAIVGQIFISLATRRLSVARTDPSLDIQEDIMKATSAILALKEALSLPSYIFTQPYLYPALSLPSPIFIYPYFNLALSLPIAIFNQPFIIFTQPYLYPS